MKAQRVPVSYQHVNNLGESIERVYARINRKAFEYYLDRGAINGFDLEDWLRAESFLIEKPDVTARLFNNEVFVEVNLPEIDAEKLALAITSQDVLVSTAPDDDGHQIFRVLHLPESIDAETVNVEFVDNSLRITAAIARAA